MWMRSARNSGLARGHGATARGFAGAALGIALSYAATVAAAGDTNGGSAMDDIKCAIEKTPTATGFDLRSVVWSDSGGSGSYRLHVSKEGASGRSSTVQEGVFSLTQGERLLLSTVSINAGPGDNVNASLVVSTDNHEVCVAEF